MRWRVRKRVASAHHGRFTDRGRRRVGFEARHHHARRRDDRGHYNGHPLYTYAGDSAPGQTTGQGSDDFGAEWYAVWAAGTPIESGR